jgi:hypothetical protein
MREAGDRYPGWCVNHVAIVHAPPQPRGSMRLNPKPSSTPATMYDAPKPETLYPKS